MSFNDRRSWKPWEKIIFRFFFPFLTLQVLTQDFLGNLFGGSLVIWALGDRIFTRPCRWLNEHFFHFTYAAPAWTTFSPALHTIRDIIYLLLSALICVVWTLCDRRRAHYDRLLYWFSQALVMVLTCIVFAYGIIKVFPVQMAAPSFSVLQTPVGNLRPFDLLWTTYGYGAPYQTFTGLFEVVGGICILFSRTRVVGLLIILSVMVNVIMLNYTFRIGVLMLSFYVLVVTLFLLAPYAGQLWRFFFSRQQAILSSNRYVPARSPKTRIPKIVGSVLIAASCLANTLYVHGLYERRQDVKRSVQYARVRQFVLNGDTLRPTENDTVYWRWWSERTTGGKRYATIWPVKLGAAKTYTVQRDTSKHILSLQASDKKDGPLLQFHYTDSGKSSWQLEGMWRQDRIKVQLQRVDPDTVFQLLKTRRRIIDSDDDGEER